MTRSTDAITAECDALYYDVEFTAARRWKEAAAGRQVFGYLPVFCPREVIHAAGALPLGISGAGDWLEVIRGDAYYQSYLCHIPRSTLELAVSGRLDFVDGMLFPSTCDVIRNLSGVWQMLKPGGYVRYVDVPQNFDPEIGGAFWEGELRAIAHEIGELTGVEVTDARLASSIRIFDENRRAVRELYALRRDDPDRAPTSEVYLVLRAGNVLPVEEHTALLREYVASARAVPRPAMDCARVVIVGAFCEQPPLGLLKTIERSGCAVVDDDLLLNSRWYTREVGVCDGAGPGDSGREPVGAGRADTLRGVGAGPVALPDSPPASPVPVRAPGTAPVGSASPAAAHADSFTALARAFVESTVPTAVMYSPRAGRGTALVDRVRAARADGVIFAAPSF